MVAPNTVGRTKPNQTPPSVTHTTQSPAPLPTGGTTGGGGLAGTPYQAGSSVHCEVGGGSTPQASRTRRGHRDHRGPAAGERVLGARPQPLPIPMPLLPRSCDGPRAGLCLTGRGALGAMPQQLQSGHRGCESGLGAVTGGWKCS